MKVIDIIEDLTTQQRSNTDLLAGKDKHPSNNLPGAVAGGAATIGVGAKVDDITKRAGKINRRFKGEAVLKTAVARVLPSVAKRSAVKSIPYLGLIAGLYFGVDSLTKGDYLGAALEVGTSLPWVGILAQVPAVCLIVARGVYDTVFEDPADPKRFVALEDDLRDDPEGTWARLRMLAGLSEKDIEARIKEAKQRMDDQKEVGDFMNDQRKSVKSAKDIEWSQGPATGNVPLARQAFNQRQRTGQEYK